MRPVAYLSQLHRSVHRRLERIEGAVHHLALPSDFQKDSLVAFAVIELDNIWSAFVRSYYLSWFLGTRTRAPVKVQLKSGSPHAFKAAIRLASRLLYGRTQVGKTGRIEPAWHEKRVLVTLAQGCSAGHLGQVQTAMSIPATVFDYLHTVRNFYAHRSEETATKLPNVARRLGVAPSRTASPVVLAVPPGRTGTVLLDWIAEVREATEILCG